MKWIKDEHRPELRGWEEFYRNRWQHDKVVRSTHGVNCTGGCSWKIYVKDGIVTWEMQALDYPLLEDGLPPYEPRGCQRGISFSWYLYSPLRVKYPYVRGALLDLWREARAAARRPGRGLGVARRGPRGARSATSGPAARAASAAPTGTRRSSSIAASIIYTVKKHGPDRIVGFSPIPAMSMLSYAAGARFLQLLGGVSLSFYDWYCDLPPASPGDLGRADRRARERRLVQRQAARRHGLQPQHDAHAGLPLRRRGAAQRRQDVWSSRPTSARSPSTPTSGSRSTPGQDGAFWMAVNHVILKEFHDERQVPYFVDYVKQYTDAPLPGRARRARRRATSPGSCCAPAAWPRYAGRGERRLEVPRCGTTRSAGRKMPKGSVGLPLGQPRRASGTWSCEDGVDGARHRPGAHLPRATPTMSSRCAFDDFGEGAHPHARRAGEARRDRRRRDRARRHRLRPADGAVRRAARPRRATTRRTTTTRTRPTPRPGRRSSPASAATTVIRFAREWARHRRADRAASA